MIVSRNNIGLDFTPEEIKRGDKKGRKYLMAKVDEATLANILEWLGTETVISIIRSRLRVLAQEASEDATTKDDTTGEDRFSQERFAENMANLATRAESIPDLLDKQQALMVELTSLDLTDASNLPKLQVISNRIKEINTTIESKRRRKPDPEND